MKPFIIAGVLGAGILFTGCETTVVEHDHYGHGYHGGGSTVYVDTHDRRYYDRGYDRHYDDHGYRGDYHTRNVERTNVHINETNVNRTVVNRTNVNVKQTPHGNGQPGAQAQVNVQKKGEDKHKGKKKNDEHHS